MTKIYYEDQKNWTKGEYCFLHRYLHRLFFYYSKHEEEISEMDLARMSSETRVLIYCIIMYYHYDFLFTKYHNLESLRDTEPLTEKLVLDDTILPEDDIYKQMNVVY